MLYTPESARARVRNENGRRVFYLQPGDRLSPSARAWLDHERIEIITDHDENPKEYKTLFGAVLRHKPEHMTHLSGNILVFKDHPRIVLRGMLDSLQAEVLLLWQQCVEADCAQLAADLSDVLSLLRNIMRCDVLSQPLETLKLSGMDEAQLREHSHHPERYYDQSHFMPEVHDSALLLHLNRVRTLSRQTELAAYRAYRDENGACGREDILRALNRLSSFLWIAMIRLKAQQQRGETQK